MNICLLFDGFGTIFNAKGIRMQASQKIIQKLKLPQTTAIQLTKNWEKTWTQKVNKAWTTKFTPAKKILEESIKEALNQLNINPTPKEIGELAQLTLNLYKQKTKIYEDAEKALKQLKNYKKALVTDADKGLVQTILEKHELKQYFQAIIISDEIESYKPNPKAFQIALKKLNCKPQNAIMIGDSEADINGAKNLGIKTILIRRDSRQIKTKPDYQITKLTQIKEILESWNKNAN